MTAIVRIQMIYCIRAINKRQSDFSWMYVLTQEDTLLDVLNFLFREDIES